MHTLILGQSFTGKSAKAKQLCSELRSRGEIVIAFNPTREQGYTIRDAFGCVGADYESHDPDLFYAHIQRVYKEGRKKIFLVIDEAHEFFTRKDCVYSWIGTRGRHYGLYVIAITQRAALINPTFRSQCGIVYAFRADYADMEMLRERYWQYNIKKEDLILANGEYLRIHHSDGITRGNISDW